MLVSMLLPPHGKVDGLRNTWHISAGSRSMALCTLCTSASSPLVSLSPLKTEYTFPKGHNTSYLVQLKAGY